jgi:hypothetical protein
MEALRIKIRSIRTPHSELHLALSIDAGGIGTVHIACGETRANRQGYLILDAAGWRELKELIAEADATIERLRQTGQLKYVAEGFQLAGE